MPKKQKGSAVVDYIVGGGTLVIIGLLILPWWLVGIMVIGGSFMAFLELVWWRTPPDLKKRLIRAEWEYEKNRKDNLAERLKAAEEEIERLRNGGS
jgi:hypothetical protein